MRLSKWMLGVAAVGAALAGVRPASAAALTLVSDPFTDNGVTNGVDPNDTAWFAGQGAGTSAGSLSVISDATLPARSEPNSNVLQWTPSASFQAIVAGYPSASLGTGDFITLSFDFRYPSTPGNNAGGGFRFGLYNNGATPATGNAAAANDNDDQGYYLSVSTGTSAPSNNLFRETGGLSGVTAGTDRVTVGTATTTATSITGTEAHTALMTITRTGATSFTILGQIDGTTVMNTTDAAGTVLLYNELAISTGGNNQALNVDNVVVTSSVPEPGTLGLLAAPGLLMLARRRRRVGVMAGC